MTMPISEIQLFNALKSKLGDQEAEQMVSYVKGYIHEVVADQVPNIATKEHVDLKIAEV